MIKNKIPTEAIFGKNVAVGSRDNEALKEETIITVPSESLEDYYKRTTAVEENIISEKEKEIDDMFSEYDFDSKESSNEESSEEEFYGEEFFEEFEEQEGQQPINFFQNREELEEEIEGITDEQLEFELNNLANQKIKELCESPYYPEGFPTYEDVLKLKIKHGKLVFVISGNLLEEFQFSIEPKLFICTTFKTKDYIEFTSIYSDEQEIMLYPFVVSRCTLFPKIDYETIMDLNAGTLKKIGDNVLINSDYKTSLEVIVL